jgi:O-antigen/teichoic acid export membrane protein
VTRTTLKRLMALPPTLWVTTETVFSQIFGLIIFSIQAPILGPYVFGLITLIMVFVGVWEAVPGGATADALISIREIDQLHFDSATTVSVVLCLAVAGAVFVFAPPLATALGHADLASPMRAMAVLPAVQAFSIAPLAAARRDMRFQSTALRTISGLFVGGVVGLALTIAGAGVWALVCQALVQRTLAAVVLWLAVPIPLRFVISRRHLGEVARFALPVMLARAMNWGGGQFPRLALGLYLGPTDLGLYSLAARLIDLVCQVAVAPKTLVARVDLRRFVGDPPAFGQAVRAVFLQISLLGFPLCLGGAAIMPTLFHAWLDPRWQAGVLPAQMLLLTGLPYVSFYVTTAALLALNLQTWEAVVSAAQAIGIALAVTAFARFGLTPTATAIAAVLPVTTVLPIMVMRRECRLSLRQIFAPQAPALVAALVMAAAVWLLRTPIEAALGSVAALFVLIASGAILYAVLIALLMLRFDIRLCRRMLRSLLPAKARLSRRVAPEL